jgi:Lon protease-like protein
MALPLRIFEERYKAMVRELLETGGQFGVLLIREGEEVGGDAVPYSVGTLAHIEQWAAMEEGRFALATRGTRRFRLLDMLPGRPYPFGEVEIIHDDNPPPGPQLSHALETVRTTFPVYFRMALSLTDQWARGMQLPSEPHALVDFLGPWLQVSEQVKQRLLEIEPAVQRVAELASILDDLLHRTREEVDEYRRGKYFGLGSQN